MQISSKSADICMAASRVADILSVISMIPDIKKTIGEH